MVLLGDMGPVESRFRAFGGGVSVGARLVHDLRQTYHGSEIILAHQMVLLGDEAQVQASFGPFRDSANLDVDWCTACAKYTIGLETFLDTPDGTPT